MVFSPFILFGARRAGRRCPPVVDSTFFSSFGAVFPPKRAKMGPKEVYYFD
jgi:hypothetical protein